MRCIDPKKIFMRLLIRIDSLSVSVIICNAWTINSYPKREPHLQNSLYVQVFHVRDKIRVMQIAVLPSHLGRTIHDYKS